MATFTADQVWACAAAAQRINGEYLKEDQWRVTGQDTSVLDKKANKHMVKEWLRTQDFSQVTEADIAAGQTARNHFKGYTLMALAGQLNDFQRTAMKIASKDEFTGRDMYDFAVISCLPEVAKRDSARNELKREIIGSEPVEGQVGDQIISDVMIIESRYNQQIGKYRITARMGESFIDFWFGRSLEGTVRIKGKIKFHRDNKTTALNYVKIL